MRSKYLLVIVPLLMVFTASAQPAPPATPIDGGLGFLIAGGVLYGVSKIRRRIRRD